MFIAHVVSLVLGGYLAFSAWADFVRYQQVLVAMVAPLRPSSQARAAAKACGGNPVVTPSEIGTYRPTNKARSRQLTALSHNCTIANAAARKWPMTTISTNALAEVRSRMLIFANQNAASSCSAHHLFSLAACCLPVMNSDHAALSRGFLL
jgi:hypothetical protein